MRSADERICEALEKCGGGPLPKDGLRVIALGSDRTVTRLEFNAALARLEAQQKIRSEWRKHFIGTGGHGCDVFWLCV